MRRLHHAVLLSFIAFTACAAAPAPDAGNAGAARSGAPAAAMPGGTAANSGAPAARGGGGGPGGGPAASRTRDTTPPYITDDTSGFFLLMPPAPESGDARDEADRRIFRETRALAGSPRWQMAAEDAELGNAAMLKHFSCSLGIDVKAEQIPRTVALLQKATREAARSVGPAKEYYHRKRPFLVDKGETCVPASTIGESYDYPSGHTTAGWAWALVLAQVDPEHAEPILKRGRAIGDSRVVCGMHNASAVESARFLTGAAMAVVAASPLYQADVVVARAELESLRKGEHLKPEPRSCVLESQLVGTYW